jgi:ankyrin repeat protein
MRRAAILAAAVLALASPVGGAGAGETGMDVLEAARAGDAETLRRLAASGASLEMRDAEGRTPLLLSVRNDHPEAAEALIAAGADVNARDAIDDTPFLYAGAEGRNAILKMILATGRADLGSTNRYGGTALIPAAHHGHRETVRILLDTAIDVDHVNRLGWTALLEAVILGDGGPVYQEIVGLLVDAGAAGIPDRDGKTPLAHARERGFTEIAARIAAGPGK